MDDYVYFLNPLTGSYKIHFSLGGREKMVYTFIPKLLPIIQETDA